MAERLAWDAASEITARGAFEDFCDWCARNQLIPPSETAFGRAFTTQIEHHGGRKVKKRERAYYEGCYFRG